MTARVVVVGGANADLKARTSEPLVAGTSNPGTASVSAGGVGRNIAENLARLGTTTALVAVVGTDPLGDLVLGATADAGVDLTAVLRRPGPTGSYTALLDHDGELVAGVADMSATDALSAADLASAEPLLAAAELVVLDGNLAAPTFAAARDLAGRHGVRVVVDPVSGPKAARLAAEVCDLWAVTPTSDELAALGGVESLVARGVSLVWERRGSRGSRLHAPGRASIDVAAVPTEVVDVTGAGDALLAAWCHAVLGGAEPVAAAAYAHRAAALTVASPMTVRPDLREMLEA